MIELRKYRISTLEEYDSFARYEDPSFRTYFNALSNLLNNMKPGEKFDIRANIPNKNLERFIKTACVYIIDQPLDEIFFSEDYNFLIKQKM